MMVSAVFFLAERIALFYCIGLGFLTLEMAMLSLIGIKFSMLSLTVCIIPLIVAALLIKPGKGKSCNHNGTDPLSALENFFILGISFELLYAFFRTLIMPMESYDAIAIYALKAKVFYINQSIPHDFFSSFKNFVPHIEYPLLIPLAETFFYTLFGSLNDLLVKIIFPLYYVALLVVFYSACRRFISRRQSLFFTFLLATIPQITDFATNGYADLPFAFYCSSAIFYLYLWIREKKGVFLILSFILSALAIWTKSEGIMFASINAVIAVIYTARGKPFNVKGYAYAVFSVLMVVVYVFAWESVGLTVNSDFASSQSSFLTRLISGFERIPQILYEYQIQFFGPKKWNIIWILLIAATVWGACVKVLSKDILPLAISILLILFGYSMVYILSSAPQGIGWHLSTTGSRLFMHFVPVAVLFLAVLFNKLKLEI
ncbi:MAG: glycosyltransferase family 39 protein [Candidatus Omnitrophota bacterium]|nr:glycosyltransferase family 39 protein [Candidatus Omnitrophota bacterium]